MSDEQKPKRKEEGPTLNRILRWMDDPSTRKGVHSDKYVRPRKKVTKVDARKHLEAIKMIQLRKDGHGVTEIAEILGCSKSKVSKFIHKELEDTPIEGIEEVRKIELEKLDDRQKVLLAVRKALFEEESKLDLLEVIDRVALLDQRLGAISQERRKMMGIDKPAKTEITGKDGAPLYQIAVSEINIAINSTLETANKNAALIAGEEPKKLPEPSQDIVVEFVEEEKVTK